AAFLLVLVPVLIGGADHPVFAVFGGMLFSIPALYLAVANSLLTVILILDKDMMMVDAFGESRRLIRNNWWRAVLLGLVIGIITASIERLFMVPTQIFSWVVLFHSTQGNNMESYTLLFIALNAISSLGLTLVAPISIVCSAIFYYSLREKKDHVALLENIDKIGVQEAKVETETKEKEDEGDF
ncbi:MAG TPA: hypothetical protein VNY36_07650, partial [Bacteroidia bacterium]|nr:hypothetical protein [Bacteroidia bacterium]